MAVYCQQILDVLVEHCLDYFNQNRTSRHNKKLLNQIKKLIQAGCDINSANYMGMTALHIAISNSLLDVAQELIKAGADINLQDEFLRGTPLHHAVKIGSKEAVCMLLYYGSDINVVHQYEMTPLMHALDMDKSEIAYTLFDYYDDFSFINSNGYSALTLALQKVNPIALDLVKAGAKINPVVKCLTCSLKYDKAELLKLIWSKIDNCIDSSTEDSLLFEYIQKCRFNSSEWLECLFLLLTSSSAFHLINDAMIYMDSHANISRTTLFSKLLFAFFIKKIQQCDRIEIIYLCLSLGAEAYFNDIVMAYKYFGSGEEIDALLYVYNKKMYNGSRWCLLPIFRVIEETDCKLETICELLKTQILFCGDILEQNLLIETLKYFSLPAEIKMLLVKSYEEHSRPSYGLEIRKKLKAITEFPSLLELSRNKVRITIKQDHNVQKPYEFYDIVKNLPIPSLIRDIICFKRPIYDLNII